MKSLFELLPILVSLLPYLLLLNKKLQLIHSLVIISATEFLLILSFLTINYFLNSLSLISFLFVFNIYGTSLIAINMFLILLMTIIRKIKSNK